MVTTCRPLGDHLATTRHPFGDNLESEWEAFCGQIVICLTICKVEALSLCHVYLSVWPYVVQWQAYECFQYEGMSYVTLAICHVSNMSYVTASVSVSGHLLAGDRHMNGRLSRATSKKPSWLMARGKSGWQEWSTKSSSSSASSLSSSASAPCEVLLWFDLISPWNTFAWLHIVIIHVLFIVFLDHHVLHRFVICQKVTEYNWSIICPAQWTTHCLPASRAFCFIGLAFAWCPLHLASISDHLVKCHRELSPGRLCYKINPNTVHLRNTMSYMTNTVCTIHQPKHSALPQSDIWRPVHFDGGLNSANLCPRLPPSHNHCSVCVPPKAVMRAYKCNWDASDNQKYHLVHDKRL